MKLAVLFLLAKEYLFIFLFSYAKGSGSWDVIKQYMVDSHIYVLPYFLVNGAVLAIVALLFYRVFEIKRAWFRVTLFILTVAVLDAILYLQFFNDFTYFLAVRILLTIISMTIITFMALTPALPKQK